MLPRGAGGWRYLSAPWGRVENGAVTAASRWVRKTAQAGSEQRDHCTELGALIFCAMRAWAIWTASAVPEMVTLRS